MTIQSSSARPRPFRVRFEDNAGPLSRQPSFSVFGPAQGVENVGALGALVSERWKLPSEVVVRFRTNEGNMLAPSLPLARVCPACDGVLLDAVVQRVRRPPHDEDRATHLNERTRRPAAAHEPPRLSRRERLVSQDGGQLVVSTASDDTVDEEEDDSKEVVNYPMSDYSDDDEPLHEKPILPPHKAGCVPEWARRDSRSMLLRAAYEQAAIDPADIFGPQVQRTIDLFEVFGHDPGAKKTRKKRKLHHHHRASSSSCASVDDFEITCVAATDLPRVVDDDGGDHDKGPFIVAGFKYVVVMRGTETFGNLRRHYAKYNKCDQYRIAFKLDNDGPDIDLDSTPFCHDMVLGATIYVHRAASPRLVSSITSCNGD
ncbi:hypothetical protein CTAYLR_007107 [Chrysophaeum taylorii]|uniref:Inner centromere protein ARK-binding domain-containing protein n=1 Tax=Chrysophaeum taylorii TaxID=2483200 RepID=A0AAD7UKY0_9STRA|nr:hypothetical protein CTAYLR_007107 [Chrysophaeum taylorii]